jgi:glutathione S-transferase
MNTALAPFLGLTPSPEAAKQAEKLLVQSLERIESVWLKGDTKYLLGSPQPSIADLCLVCEIMQLEVCMFPVSVYAISSSLLHCCNT